MKQSTFFAMLFGATMVLLISCGGNDEKKNSESSTSTDTTAASTTPAVNTTITTPQGMMSVMHKVADFAKWKMAYDGHDSARLANGIHNYVVARGVEDSNMVFVTTKVEDMDKAKAFAKDPGLKKAMQKGGVVGAPTISFATMVFQDTAAVDSKLRSRTTFKVKDWDAWKKAFDSTRGMITDNGLTVRAYGHDPADNHSVVLVTAITDTAKARAYWNSDVLKQRRAASGVIGTPQRFIFTIVQRY
jgi:heme-degrading monooxygenase HmoA